MDDYLTQYKQSTGKAAPSSSKDQKKQPPHVDAGVNVLSVNTPGGSEQGFNNPTYLQGVGTMELAGGTVPMIRESAAADTENGEVNIGFEGMSQQHPPTGVYPRLSNPIGFEEEGPVPPPAAPPGGQPHEMDEQDAAHEMDEFPAGVYNKAMEGEKAALVKNTSAAGETPSYSGTSTGDVTLVVNADEQTPGVKDEVPDKNTLMFRDGERRIDYVLAYTDLKEESQLHKRDEFHKELVREGLQLEIEDKKFSQDLQTYFCKIHMPWKMCLVYAELFKMKMPIHTNDIDAPLTAQCCTPCGSCRPNVEEEEDFFTAPFYKDGTFVGYEGKDVPKPDFFSAAQRSRMVHEVLLRARYGAEQQQFGIKRLHGQGIYTAYYPLHDGPYESESAGVDIIHNKRQELFYEWARPGAFMKEQPYDAIRHYFGEKVAIYFSWLGFYTLMLVPASIVGIAVTIYGAATIGTDDSSAEICGENGGIIMCPQCDERCNYWRLNTSCTYSKATYVVDNPGTIFFTIFMALWATFFMEFWKRHQARIQYDWDVADYEETEQSMRPEFQATVTSKKKNPITQDYEPHMRSMERCLRVGSSFIFLVFLLCLVLVAILGVIIYRIIIVILIYRGSDDVLKSQARLVTTITAACISVVVITLLNKIYEKLAVFLTNMETWKYQSEWEDAFTFKMYLFQFVNYYGTIVYIAFFKGRLVGSPDKYDRSFGGYRGEECDPAGCLIELAIQLAIVMVGKQTLNNFKEIIIPIVVRLIKSRKGRKKQETEEDKYTRWERDYDLVDFPIHGLYEEYLEMVIQYGFVTLFVAAFPLAPFFALLNNIIEVRLDATKMVTQWKRPMAARAQDIGTWFFILQAISKLAVLVNACIIAFTSDFVQKMIYKYTVEVNLGDGFTNQTYIEWSLSAFRTSDFDPESKPNATVEENGFGNANYSEHVCWYRDFKNSPYSSDWVAGDNTTHYIYTSTYWHVMTAKLAFVLIFEHLVLAFASLINFLIPDVPIDVRDRTLREKHLAKVAMHERIKGDSGLQAKNGTTF